MNNNLFVLTKRKLTNNSKEVLLTILGLNIYSSHQSLKAGWFRLFGVGVSWKHESLGLLFSERIGSRKYIKLGEWIFKFLK